MSMRWFGAIAYLRLSLIDRREEEEVGQKEADAELQVEGGARVLDGSAQEEGEGCQEEAQQRETQSQVGDRIQNGIHLRSTKGGIRYSLRLCTYLPDGESERLLTSAPCISDLTSLKLGASILKMGT